MAEFLVLPAAPPAVLELTKREQAILGLLVQGKDNRTIARELSLAPQTVRNYLSRFYAKLGVSSRMEAFIWAHFHWSFKLPSEEHGSGVQDSG